MTRPASVVLAGGGTTGHISPLLATAEEIGTRWPDTRLTVLGSHGGLEETIVPAAGLDLRLIPKAAFPRRPDLAAAKFPATLRSGIVQTGALLDEVDADVVVGFGGFVSPPAYLAARRRGIPTVIHEQNARPGLANRLGARSTPFVAVTFSSTKLPHARVIGLPLRRQITELDRTGMRAQARRQFGLDDDRPTVLVTGGSLGAAKLNRTFEASRAALDDAGVQVLHVTGRGKTFEPAPGTTPYVVLEYADRMDLCYAAADLVVTRAGAGMVCETTAVALPAVFVPLPIGNGEQRLNAADVVAAGGALLTEDDRVDPAWVSSTVIPLVQDPDRLARMSEAMRGQGHARAAGALVDLIAQAAESRR